MIQAAALGSSWTSRFIPLRGLSTNTTKACTIGDVGLTWIPKAASSIITPFGFSKKTTHLLDAPIGLIFAGRRCSTKIHILAILPLSALFFPLHAHASTGGEVLHSSVPSNVFASRSYYTYTSGGRRNSGIRILFGLGGLFAAFLMKVVADSDLSKQEDLVLKPGIDWVKLGCTPPVVPANYSKGCGCCFAITAVQNVESVLMIETGQSPRLSIQEIIDCLGEDSKGVPYGCLGGFVSVAFDYMMKNGLATDLSYPVNLNQRQGPCIAVGKPRAFRLLDWEQLPGVDDYKYDLGKTPPISVEDSFKLALYKSPISVRFESNQFFQEFKGKSIIEYHQCPPPAEKKGGNHTFLLCNQEFKGKSIIEFCLSVMVLTAWETIFG